MSKTIDEFYKYMLSKPDYSAEVFNLEKSLAEVRDYHNRAGEGETKGSSPEYRRRFRKNPLLLAEFVRKLVKSEMLKEAIRELHMAVKLNKKLFLPHYYLGIIYHMQDQFALAIKHANFAVKYGPNEGCCYAMRGFINTTKRHKHQLALKDFSKAISLGIKDAPVYAGRAWAKFNIRKPGMVELALKDFETAKELGDKNSVEFLKTYYENHKTHERMMKAKNN